MPTGEGACLEVLLPAGHRLGFTCRCPGCDCAARGARACFSRLAEDESVRLAHHDGVLSPSHQRTIAAEAKPTRADAAMVSNATGWREIRTTRNARKTLRFLPLGTDPIGGMAIAVLLPALMPRVLFIDDNEKLSHFSGRYLELRIPRLETAHAADCQGARLAARHLQPDCIIMDWQLPDGGGVSLLKELQQIAPSSPVLVVTAEQPSRLQSAAHAAGALQVIGKPYEIDDLVAAVERALRSDTRQPGGPDVVVAGERRSTLLEERHHIFNRLAGLLAGLHAFAADLRAGAHEPDVVNATVDLYTERLVEAVQDVSNRLKRLTDETDDGGT